MASITFQSGEWIEYPFFNAFADARDVLDMADVAYIKYYDNDNEQHVICYELYDGCILYIFGKAYDLRDTVDVSNRLKVRNEIRKIVKENVCEFNNFA